MTPGGRAARETCVAAGAGGRFPRWPYNGRTPQRGNPLAKPNYSFEKRQREIAKKKKQDEKDARKREAREAAQAAKSGAAHEPSTPE